MILVVGATGTVGRRVIDALLANPQIPVRAIARGKSDWAGSMLPAFRRRGVEVMVGDVRSESLIDRAVKGCTAIINCSGAMRAYPDEDLESVNIDGVSNLVQLGQEAGVQRFIQLSCMGATEHSTGLYFGCKWDAEALVKNSKFYWTIFRPSLIFDEESTLFRILDFWVERAPLQVVVGSGLNRFQPISAIEVAACIAKSVYDRETVGKSYDLVGPEKLDLQTLLAMVAENHGKEFRPLRLPSFLGVPLAGLIGKLNKNSPIDNNVMKVLTTEMMADPKPMMQKFQLENRILLETALEESRRLSSSRGKNHSNISSAAAEANGDDEHEEDEDEEEEDSEDEISEMNNKAKIQANNKAGDKGLSASNSNKTLGQPARGVGKLASPAKNTGSNNSSKSSSLDNKAGAAEKVNKGNPGENSSGNRPAGRRDNTMSAPPVSNTKKNAEDLDN